jgi:hypothetical protein
MRGEQRTLAEIGDGDIAQNRSRAYATGLPAIKPNSKLTWA